MSVIETPTTVVIEHLDFDTGCDCAGPGCGHCSPAEWIARLIPHEGCETEKKNLLCHLCVNHRAWKCGSCGEGGLKIIVEGHL